MRYLEPHRQLLDLVDDEVFRRGTGPDDFDEVFGGGGVAGRNRRVSREELSLSRLPTRARSSGGFEFPPHCPDQPLLGWRGLPAENKSNGPAAAAVPPGNSRYPGNHLQTGI